MCLASSGSDLLLSALGTLLAHVALLLGLGGGSSVLGLLGLLGGLGSSLLLLVGLDGLSAGGRSGLGAHGTALLDDLEGGTNDGTLGLDGAAGALLGNFLQRGSVITLSGVCFRLLHISSSSLVRVGYIDLDKVVPLIIFHHRRQDKEREGRWKKAFRTS